MMKNNWNEIYFIDRGGGVVDVYLDETLDCIICKVLRLSDIMSYWQAQRFGQPITEKYDYFEEIAEYLRKTL